MNSREVTVGGLRVLGVFFLATAAIEFPGFVNGLVNTIIVLVGSGETTAARAMFITCFALIVQVLEMALRILIGIYLMKRAESTTAWILGDRTPPAQTPAA